MERLFASERHEQLLEHLRIHNASPPLRSLHQIGILLLQNFIVLLSLPVPNTVRGKNYIHLLKRTLVSFGVKCPDEPG